MTQMTPVSPMFVARILIIQNNNVTRGTLLKISAPVSKTFSRRNLFLENQMFHSQPDCT